MDLNLIRHKPGSQISLDDRYLTKTYFVFIPTERVGNSLEIFFTRVRVGNENSNDITHGKLQAEEVKCLNQDEMAKSMFKYQCTFHLQQESLKLCSRFLS